MSGWGASIVGLSSVFQLFEQLKFQFDGGTVFVVGPTVRYSIYVDQGTSKMDARPFVKPAAERVEANLSHYVDQFATELNEESVVRAAALGVEQEMMRIITQKGAVDTGTLRASVTVEKVQ